MFQRKEKMPPHLQTEIGKGAALFELMPPGISINRINPERKLNGRRGYTHQAKWHSLKPIYGNSVLEVLDGLRQRYEPLRNIGKEITYKDFTDQLLE